MLEAVRKFFFTQNDETRILVRSRESKNAPFKYNVEYIHAELSQEVKQLVMKYEEGSRDHSIQEENFFKGSNIKYFLCDRAKMYETIGMHNNAIERMFRHIAIGRRNWLHTGSHFAAENIAFMYSLLESCKLNNVNFGKYIEDILTRLMKGERVDMSFLPNNYVPRPKEEAKEAA